MIFEQKYDNSLWLMLNSDKRVENEVLKFFNRFPQELLLKIRESIGKYNEQDIEQLFLKDVDWFKDNLSGSFRINDGLMYRYSINVFGALEISETFDFDDKEINLDCITLYPFDLNDVNNMLNFDKITVGLFGSGFDMVGDFVSVPTKLLTSVVFLKYPFINIVNSKGFLTNFKSSLYKIDIKDIPSEYSLNVIQEKYNSKKLVRKKKSN